jgi:Ca-activated chloride channel family protein
MLEYFKHIEFANPAYLYLLLIIPILIVWYIFRNFSSFAEIQFPSFSPFATLKKTLKQRLYHLLFVLRLLCIALIIIVLARPQSSLSHKNVSIEGIDIVLAYDISSSMLAEDFKPNRIEAAREIGLQFIDGRPNDRMGLVVFSGEAYTQCPLTSDHGVLKSLFLQVKNGLIDDGTAIGDGLATAVSRIKESKAISKVIILMTDGENNKGAIDPLSAAEIAKLFGVRVYTIGIGSIGFAPYPFQTPFGIQYQNMEVKIDEALLKQIAKTTNGNYYRATSKTKLDNIFKEIDKLEKSKIDVTEFQKKSEEFLYFLILAALLLILEITLRYTIYRTIP